PNPGPERPRSRALPTSAEAGPTSSAVEAGLRFWPRCLPSPGLLSSVDISGIGRRHLLAEIGRDHGPWVAVMPGPAGSPSGFCTVTEFLRDLDKPTKTGPRTRLSEA